MKPAAVVAGVFDFEGKEGECEDEGGEEDVDDVEDVNGLITNLRVLICLRKSMLVLRTYLRKLKLSTYTSRCGVIYLF
jgi:hypothetical protein